MWISPGNLIHLLSVGICGTICLTKENTHMQTETHSHAIRTCLHWFLGSFCKFLLLCLVICRLDLWVKKEQNPFRWCTYWSIQSSVLFSVPSGTYMLQTLRHRWRREASAWTRSPCCCWFCTCRSSALAPSASSSAACSRGSGVNRGHSRWWADLSLRPGLYLLLQKQHDEHQEGERFWEYCEDRGWFLEMM